MNAPVRKERPILFSAPMVLAILAGTKSQTRRVVKPKHFAYMDEHQGLRERDNADVCPHGKPGDQLWVREAWRQAYPPGMGSSGIIYRADAPRACGMDEYSDRHKWKPGIHMFRKDARILLDITGVRVERLNDISEADAKAEGIVRLEPGRVIGGVRCDSAPSQYGLADNSFLSCSATDSYRLLWKSINGIESWGDDPFVWVVSFQRITTTKGETNG